MTASITTAFPFSYVDVPAGLTDQQMTVGGSAVGLVCRKAGYLVGLSAVVDAQRSADSLTVKPGKATTAGGAFSALAATGLNVTIDGTSSYQNYASVAYGTSGYSFNAGDRLCPLITTGGSWSPITADLVVVLEILFSA